MDEKFIIQIEIILLNSSMITISLNKDNEVILFVNQYFQHNKHQPFSPK